MVSVVLALYNGEKFLAEQARSILLQTERDIELIIVDDASQDAGAALAAEFARQDPRVKVHRNEHNLGIAANFLKGISLAQGDLICLSDQDDVWRENKIKVLQALLRRDRRNMLAYSDLEVCDEVLRPTHASFWKAAGIKPRRGSLKERAFLRNIIPGCSLMFRREIKDVMGRMGWQTPFMHDHLAFVIASGLGRVVYTPERLVRYRQHTGNNIGAFYASTHDRSHFVESIRQKTAYVRKVSGKFGADLDKIESFCDGLMDGGARRRAAFMPYYLFLRNDTFKDKTLGVFECLMPGVYHWLRVKIK